MRFFSLIFLAACGTRSSTVDIDEPTTESNSGGYTWGEAGGSDDGSSEESDTTTEDGTDTTTDGDDTDDSDTDDTDTDVEVTADFVLFTDNRWESSLDWEGAPEVSMYETANWSEGDWDGYGSATTSTGGVSDDGVVMDEENYTPGQILVTNAVWWNGYAWVYFADTGNTVNAASDDWDDDGDDEKVIVIIFEDDTYDVLEIDESGVLDPETSVPGEAFYYEGGGYHDIYLHTPDHTTGDYDL